LDKPDLANQDFRQFLAGTTALDFNSEKLTPLERRKLIVHWMTYRNDDPCYQINWKKIQQAWNEWLNEE
jgi:hypothetical protein